MELSEDEITALRWMVSCNQSGVGFLGPTVRKTGHLSRYDRLLAKGLARVVEYPAIAKECGYWIQPIGRAALTPSPASR